MPKLRYFLYLDDPVVSQFLSQVEGGEFDDQRIKDQYSQGSGLGGAVSAGPISFNAERTSGGSSESELTMRQTGPSRFNRLHRALAQDDLTTISAVDDSIWSGFEVGEIIEVSVQPSVPEFVQNAAQIGDVAKLAPLVDLMRQVDGLGLPGVELDHDTRQTIAQAEKFLPAAAGLADAMAGAPVPCVFSLVGSPNFKFFAQLDRNNLLVDVSELAGDLTLLAKIDRFVAQRKPEDVSVMAGLPVPSRAQRRSGASSAPTVTLRHPAAFVSAVALYR